MKRSTAKPKRAGSKGDTAPFWEDTSLSALTRSQWESLCDRCGLCCVFKIEDDKTGEVYLTNVACPLLDLDTCLCGDYTHRQKVIPDCAKLTPRSVRKLAFLLPPTCAYRRLAEGQSLPTWHPLVTSDPTSPRRAGMTARNHLVERRHEDALERHIVRRLTMDKAGGSTCDG